MVGRFSVPSPALSVRYTDFVWSTYRTRSSFSGTIVNPVRNRYQSLASLETIHSTAAFDKYRGLYILMCNAQCYPVRLVESVPNVIEGDCKV